MLFNEPKLLKLRLIWREQSADVRFSALQRAEIAEILKRQSVWLFGVRFSALQRAEIAEIARQRAAYSGRRRVSVLFNEPKLLK